MFPDPLDSEQYPLEYFVKLPPPESNPTPLRKFFSEHFWHSATNAEPYTEFCRVPLWGPTDYDDTREVGVQEYYLVVRNQERSKLGVVWYKINISCLILFLGGSVSTIAIVALFSSAILAADIASYALISSAILTIIGGIEMVGLYQNTKFEPNVEDLSMPMSSPDQRTVATYGGAIVMSTLVGYSLFYRGLIANGVFGPLSILEQAGIAACFALILPAIASLIYGISENQEEGLAFFQTQVLPLLAGTVLGTFSAIAMNLETGSMILNITATALTACAIAIATTIITSFIAGIICHGPPQRERLLVNSNFVV